MVSQLDKLIIYFEGDLVQPIWLVTDAKFQPKTLVFHGESENLTITAQNKSVLVIVPAEEVLITTVKLPPMSQARLTQALPFALEEQLVGDIESLHFVSEFTQVNGELGVAVVSHERVRQWLSRLADLNIKPDKLIPLFLLVPFNEDGNWHLCITPNRMAILRTDLYAGFTCDLPNVNEYLSTVIATQALPNQLVIHNFSEESIASSLTGPIEFEELMLPKEEMLPDLLANVKKPISFNLLQDIYSQKRSSAESIKLWRMIAAMGALLLLTLILYPMVSYFILKKRNDELTETMTALFQREFPQTPMIDPRAKMQEKLQKTQEQLGENRILQILAYVAKGITANIEINRFDYANRQMTLVISAKTSGDISKFINFLTRQGFNVRQQNATLTSTGVNTTLVIT